MASYLDKTKITVGIDKNTSLDLSCQHITTADWMEGIPVYLKEMVPGESIKVHQETFSRMAPLAVPTFGRALIHNRAFFVPFRTIFHAWDEFITSVKHTNQLIVGSGTASTNAYNVNKVPFISNISLVNFFLGSTNNHSGGDQIVLPVINQGAYNLSLNNTTRQLNYVGSGAVTNPSTQINDTMIANGQYDIALAWFVGSNNPETRYFRLTSRGKRFMKLIESLGYKIIWAAAGDQAGEQVLYERVADNMPEYSALPLLAYWKVILDWYYPSQYVGDSSYMYVDSLIHAAVGSGQSGLQITELMLRNVFLGTGGGLNSFSGLVNYDSDYFVSAFDNPIGASEGNTSPMIIQDVTDSDGINGGFVEGTITTTPALYNNVTSNFITQYAIDSLKALTDYVKRNQLVGARALDRFYARFGKRLSDAKLDRSNYIGADNIPLQFADVMSHTASQDAPLGGYAGKGIAYGPNGNFEYQSGDDYGYIIIISSIVPQVGYYQGIDRNLLHLGRTDFWTPEFDQLGNQAIAKMEVVVPMNLARDTDAQSANDFWAADTGDNANDGITGVFGWTPRYAEYKIGRDKLTGDWRYGTTSLVGDTSDSWHLMRNIGGRMQSVLGIVHDKYVVSGFDRNQYSRIFQNINTGSDVDFTNADKFYMIHNFNVISQSPMHSLYDSYKFENEDDSKKVVADVNGVKVN